MTMESKMHGAGQSQQAGGNNTGGQQQQQAVTKQGPNSAAAAAGPPASPSRLFVSTLLEPKDDLDHKHEGCYQTVMTIISDKGEKEAHDALIKAADQAKTHEEVSLGFLVAILSPSAHESVGGPGRLYRDLITVNRDGLTCVLGHLNHLVIDKYLKMYPATKQQLMWLIRELIRASVAGMENVCWNLMRQVAGGDVSKSNLWLADILVDIFSENRGWLDKHSFLVAAVAYTYTRLVEDHVHHEKLREKEVKFVVPLIREKWTDVAVIGRDFLRILQYVAKVPEFEALWRDILYNPRALSPTFAGGFMQLMHTRTSRRFLQSRITPEMEKKIYFLTSQVKFGTHKRYQDWFQRQYLATTESQSLRCDLIRYIIGVIHPTNELLCSDIIPRWAVIGWLLTTCTSQHFCSNARLSLFYDWLFFEPEKDNIMNIEPAILVMHHSMRPHPAITATLLDFLCRIIHNFHPREQEAVRSGIYNSLRMILDKRVLPSLAPLFDNPKLDKELRAMLRERFLPFCGPGSDSTPAQNAPSVHGGVMADDDADNDADGDVGGVGGAKFSDDEEEDENESSGDGRDAAVASAAAATPVVAAGAADSSDTGKENHKPEAKAPMPQAPPSSTTAKEEPAAAAKPTKPFTNPFTSGSSNKVVKTTRQQQHQPVPSDVKSDPDDPDDMDGEEEEEEADLNEEMKEIIRDFKKARSEDEQCELTEQLVKSYVSAGDGGGSYVRCKALASALADLLQDQFEGKIFPDVEGGGGDLEEAVEESVGGPLFVIFRALCEMTDSDTHRGQLLKLLGEFYALQPRVGYYLLYFLNASNRHINRDSKAEANVYRDLCEEIDSEFSLDICLVNDMRQCQEDDVSLFVYLIPDIYRHFSKHAVGNVDLLYLVVSCVDGRQVQQLVCNVVAKDFHMFKKDSVQMALQASLNWETFEQYAFWQLLSAHGLPFECVLPLVPKLRHSAHSEALTSVLLLIKQERPTAEMLKHLLAREVTAKDRFVSSCLTYWMHEHEDRLSELISDYLSKQASSSSSSSNKRKRNHQSSLSSNIATGSASGSEKLNTNSSSGSGPAGGKNGVLSHSAELTLGHLDQLRNANTSGNATVSFFTTGIQSALQQVRSSCTDSQKKKFMDLFALAAESDSEDELLMTSSKNKRKQTSNRNSPNRSSKSAKKPASSDDGSSEAEESKSKKGSRGSGAKSKSGSGARKRGAAGRISTYKELGSTDENSSDEDDLLVNKKTPKKRRKMSDSD